MSNEQKRYKSHIQRLQSEVNAVEKMRAETVSLRIKNQDVRDERANLQLTIIGQSKNETLLF